MYEKDSNFFSMIFAILFCSGSFFAAETSEEIALLFTGASNTYLYGNSGEAVIIDAGAEPDSIISMVIKNKLKVKYILLTHAHSDHIPYAKTLRQQLSAQLVLHQDDLPMLRKVSPQTTIDATVVGGEIIAIGAKRLKILHTPGHSPGSICIVAPDMIFTGDTLFKGSIGRTDFEGGSMESMKLSLKKLMKYDNNMMILPGHGEPSSIGSERNNNNWIHALVK